MDGWLGTGSAKSAVTVFAGSAWRRAMLAGCAGSATTRVQQIATRAVAAGGAAIVVGTLRLFSRAHPPLQSAVIFIGDAGVMLAGRLCCHTIRLRTPAITLLACAPRCSSTLRTSAASLPSG